MRHVAVLGAGIMGASAALFLARRGARVTLLDAAAAPFGGASRWNEGKIHLGYLYAADASFETARRLLPGGLAFKTLTEELIGCRLDPAISLGDEVYAIHRGSVAGVEETARYYEGCAALATSCGDLAHYLAPLQHARPAALGRAELEGAYDTRAILAAFRVPERSVSTGWVADRFVEALSAEPRIETRLRTRVRAVRGRDGTLDGPLFVDTSAGEEGPFDAVVNALWEGRLAVDASLGLPLPATWTHRFRLSAFVRTSRPVDVASTVVATGPFGDVKNYTGRDLYLSWYTSGLVAQGCGIAPPDVPALDEDGESRLLDEVFDRLGGLVASVRGLRPLVESARLAGGWVYAAGRGPLDQRTSTLHRRDRVGIERRGAYLSVDTGKYSIAPWLARQVAEQLV